MAPPLLPDRTQNPKMRNEIQNLVDEIQQGIGLLRRHL
jgi:hypothetical protein